MATESGWVSPITRLGATVAFGLVALGVAATVWTITFASWWQVVGLSSAVPVATVVSLVPLVGLGYVGIAAADGPTLSMATYLGCFAGVSIAFFVAVWTTVFLFALFPLGVTTAATAAGALTLVCLVAITVIAAATIVALGRSVDWSLVLRMAVAMLLLVLVTIGFLAAVWLVVSLLAALFVGPILGLYVAGGVTLVVIAIVAYQEFTQVRSIEDRIDATPTTANDLPGIHAMTTTVASQLGVPKPTIAISETYAPESMVVGFRPDTTHLILSYGAVTALSADELEAVIAHELAHVANRDATVMTAVSTPLVLADGLRARVRTNAFREDEDEEWQPPEMSPDADEEEDDDGWIVKMTLFVVATITWIISRAIVAVLSRARETAADRTAADVTGSPAALAGALRTLDDRIEQTPNRDLREAASVSSLSILPLEPVTVETDDPSLLDRLRLRLFRTHPPTEQRLAALEALEREQR